MTKYQVEMALARQVEMALARYNQARDKIEALGVDETLIDELEEAFIDLTLAEVAARPTIRAGRRMTALPAASH